MGTAAAFVSPTVVPRLGVTAAEEFNRLAAAVDEIMRMLSALSARVKTSGSRGNLELIAKG
jgi:hypothetical protein